MRLVATNDDGIHAPGLGALVEALAPLGEVVVVAPNRERSATAHAITLHEPLRVEKVSRNGAFFGHAVSGTPVDCVKLAVVSLLAERPDFLVSGINPGTNVGTNAIYSGTVSAALEGAMNGITSLAVSIDASGDVSGDELDYVGAAAFTRRFIERLASGGLARPTAFNINLPNLPADRIKGMRFTHQGRLMFREEFHERTDPQRRVYYWLGGELPVSDDGAHADSTAVLDGYIAVTPLHYDLTDYDALDQMRAWEVE
ncbi:MAG: 5'/3'-nucleotidase SurE [Verrucomicrobia bacterium]|nr:5'/3'-nucleotidase SurE [Verrucomicrobiota bacterium]